jgi:hypothetical protein
MLGNDWFELWKLFNSRKKGNRKRASILSQQSYLIDDNQSIRLQWTA